MSEPIRKVQITFTDNSPLQITDSVESDTAGLSDEQQSIVQQLGATLKSYRAAAKELLSGKYAHLRDWAPTHLADPGNVLVICCPDGVAIRFENKTDKVRLIAGWMSDSLPEVASMLSQRLIQCHTNRDAIASASPTGMEIRLSTGNVATNQLRDIVAMQVRFDAVIERPDRLPQPPLKPFCLLSIRSTFEIQVGGELLKNNRDQGQGQPFIARSKLRLPVGWDCIEIFPYFDLEQWKPEYAPLWAENDLLAAVVAQQFREAQFLALDPNAQARKQFGELLRTYRELLDSNPEREETLQSFLQDHPAILCPTHIKMWPKMAFGARKTDFVFQEATGDYLLVELEKSTLPLFLKDGHPSRELNHARGQVTDWKRYLEDNVATVQKELGLTGISANPRSLVVIGRSQTLTPENRRKLVTIENENPKTKIVTYDDVYEAAKAVIENLLGPIWDTIGNTHIYYPKIG